MNKYDDEATQLRDTDNEATHFEDVNSEQNINEACAQAENGKEKGKTAKGSTWKRVAAGAGSGLLIGSVATILMGMNKADSDNPEKTDGKEELSHPEWVDDEVAVATSVNEDMSFGEAFAAARAEVGPGGVFEWHGQIYGTYYADEWNSMTAEQRAEYGEHFNWNQIDGSESNVAQHTTTAQHQDSTNATAHAASNDDDIDVVSVTHNDNNNNQPHDNNTQVTQATDAQPGEPEIEILGVMHDDETNTNIGGLRVDNQDVILVDVQNDLTFDFMASDTNGNHKIDQTEIVDIQQQNITVNSLGGFSNPATGDLYANNDAPDYDVYEG